MATLTGTPHLAGLAWQVPWKPVAGRPPLAQEAHLLCPSAAAHGGDEPGQDRCPTGSSLAARGPDPELRNKHLCLESQMETDKPAIID